MRIFTRIRKIPLARKIIRLNKETGREPADSLKYIIFAHARTGSSVLGMILNLHPELNLAHEPFRQKLLIKSTLHPISIGNKKLPITKKEEFKSALNKIGWGFNGLKHLYGNVDREFNEILLTKKGAKIIFLQRKNILQSVISNLMAIETKKWGGRIRIWDKILHKRKIQPFKIKAIKHRMEQIQKETEYYKKVLKDNNVDYYNLYYEDIFGTGLTGRQKLDKINELFNFFGVKPLNSTDDTKEIRQFLNPRKRKINSKKTYRLIPNHQKIERECGSDETGWLFK